MSHIVNNKIEDYIRKNASKEPEILKDLNKETHLKVLNPRMLSGHIQGRFLSIITKLIKPKKILEIGTYTGYSAICMAEGLIEKGIISFSTTESLPLPFGSTIFGISIIRTSCNFDFIVSYLNSHTVCFTSTPLESI